MDANDTHGRPHYTVTVNNTPITFSDPIVTGRALLSEAGFDPASEHMLVQVARKRTDLIGLDAEVNIRDEPASQFRASLSDRALSFTIDERGYIWGTAKISVEDLLLIAGVGDDVDLVLEREGEPDLVLDRDGFVDLSQPGSQHIRSKKRGTEYVNVTVYATGGIYPEEGSVRERRDQPLRHVLHQAARALGLTQTTDWIVLTNDSEIDPNQTYASLGLNGHVSLDWQPREGGGGNE